jgi:hypothetical protein
MPQRVAFEPTTPHYRFGTVIDGVQYIIDARWNGRDGAWYFDLLLSDETIILSGIKIVLGALLGSRSANASAPAGYFFAGDSSGDNRDAGLDDLGHRVFVYFYTDAEMAALLAAAGL